MLEELKARVCEVNLELVNRSLVLMTWGNASAIDRGQGLVVIKPSGVDYGVMRPEDMTVIDLEGEVIEGELRPSVDMPAHLAMYRAWSGVNGIVHTHSHYATAWAQACRPIPCFGTTHADYFHGDVPLTEPLSASEVADEYENHIGKAIVRCFDERDPLDCPAVLCAQHASFAWGLSVEKALESATVLEEVARMALHTVMLSSKRPAIDAYLLDKHFLRKHGSGAYYGQDKP